MGVKVFLYVNRCSECPFCKKGEARTICSHAYGIDRVKIKNAEEQPPLACPFRVLE